MQAGLVTDPSSGTALLLDLSSDDCSYPGRWKWNVRSPWYDLQNVRSDKESILSKLLFLQSSRESTVICPMRSFMT